MAVRLPVVLSQTTSRSPRQTSIEEDWITYLLFESGLDATLIGSLSGVTEESTDRLCLEGIKGDFLLMSWFDGSTTETELVRLLGTSIRLIPINGSNIENSGSQAGLNQSSSSGDTAGSLVDEKVSGGQKLVINAERMKKVYFYQMTENDNLGLGKIRIQELFKSLSTPVFQLGLSKPIPKPVKITSPIATEGATIGSSSKDLSASDKSEISRPIDSSGVRARHLASPNTSTPVAENEDLDGIDALVDELNELDI